ncbi:MAG: exopolysaccharide biosynthesis protein [Cyanobacteria bacterium P01_G01_bin.19]
MSLRFSQELNRLLIKLSVQPISIAEILRQTGKRGFCLVISLLVLPFLFPMPPGLSGVMGLGCLILGGQMALGRKSPWLPKRVARFKFPRTLTQQLLKSVRRLITWLERIVRSRWVGISKHPYAWRGNGLCIAWLSVLLMLPIPFTNPLPAIAILLLAVATIESDGLLMCVGYLLSFGNTVFFSTIGYVFWQLPHLVPNFFR